jgi:hypothetical protein
VAGHLAFPVNKLADLRFSSTSGAGAYGSMPALACRRGIPSSPVGCLFAPALCSSVFRFDFLPFSFTPSYAFLAW